MNHKITLTRPIRTRRVFGRKREIVQLCRGQRVLHLGCADYPNTEKRGEDLLHRHLMEVTSELWGVDHAAEGVRSLRGMGIPNIIEGDVIQLETLDLPRTFDIILAAEVLEKQTNPGLALQSICNVMSDDTLLIVTTPNALAFKGAIHALLRREKAHASHKMLFSYYTLTTLLESMELQIEDLYYTQVIHGNLIEVSLDRLLSLATYISPVFSDGLFALCRHPNYAKARTRESPTEDSR